MAPRSVLATVLLSPLFVAASLIAIPEARAQDGAPPPPPPASLPNRGNLLPPAGDPSTPPPATTPPPVPGAADPATPAAGTVDPAADQQKLATQGRDRPLSQTNDGSIGASPREVYSEDWWGHTRPILEIHGYFRTRGELYHNFALGRHTSPGGDDHNLWNHPLDHTYTDKSTSEKKVSKCGDSGADPCYDKTQSSANLRLRLNPELHISDNLRVLTQIDLLDNLVLGSTPDSYAIQPSSVAKSPYAPAGNGYNGYAPLGVFATNQGAPTAGVNGYRNSIEVKRAWAEYLSPIGQFRFGRMPSHWGLGMLAHSGDGIDDDWQTNTDRIMFVTGLRSADLYFGGSWDFVSSGPTNASPFDIYGGQPYNTANLTNADEWSLFVARRMNPELQKAALARGDVVLNGGLYALYRQQLLDVPDAQTPLTFDAGAENNGLIRRGAKAFIPDAWVQARWRKLRLEAEVVHIRGEIDSIPGYTDQVKNPTQVRMWGVATQAEYRAVDDKLRLQFGFGWASGDPEVEGIAVDPKGLKAPQGGDPKQIRTFRFHPAYMVDQIFFRKILTRVEGAYYFRPSVDYDFLRNPAGQKFGGGAAIIWSRASEFIQTPGDKRDLGVELDLSLYYQAKDGSLNDDPAKIGGFYTMLQYGVFFPLGGLDYHPVERKLADMDLSAAQTLRLFLGVVF